jgi:hypothetical protein
MFFPGPEPIHRQAKSPHELTMVNLLIFNLLMLIALLGGSFVEPDSRLAPFRALWVMVPLGISLAIVAYSIPARATHGACGPLVPGRPLAAGERALPGLAGRLSGGRRSDRARLGSWPIPKNCPGCRQ